MKTREREKQTCGRCRFSLEHGPVRTEGPVRGEASRRYFLRSAGLGIIGLAAAGPSSIGAVSAAAGLPSAPSAPRYPGRVVEAFNANVLADGRVRQDAVDAMLERGMLQLTGARTLADAWKLFVTPDDVVGLKVNTLSGPLCSTRLEVVRAVIKGLALAGVRDSNVIIWDRFESHLRRARYQVQQRRGLLRCYATDSAGVGSDLDVFYRANTIDWMPDALKKDLQKEMARVYPNSHFSKIFTAHVTKQINLPILKDHNISGVTLALKNVAFGICNNTERFHPTPINCDPMIPEVFSHPMVRAKNVLNIADCLTVLYEGGPMVDAQYLLPYRSLIVATDAVALDQVGLEILEQIRGEKRLPSLWKTSSPPKYLTTAGKMGLGESDLRKIARVKV
jgi:uncharacterized protein (DUF362 family)